MSALLVVAGLQPLAHAQGAPNVTLTVDQSHVFFTAEPGESEEKRIHVTYDGPGRAELLWEVRDFEGLPDGSLFFPPPVEGRPSPSRWVGVGAHAVTLDSGLRTALPIRLTPSPGTPPGEYAALLLLYLEQQVGEGVWLRPQLGVRLYTAIPGDLLRRAGLGPLSAPVLADIEPVMVSTRLHNTGTVHVAVSGVVRARAARFGPLQLGGESTVSGAAPTVYVLPGESRDLLQQWTPPGYGLYHVAYDAADPAIADGPEATVAVLPIRVAAPVFLAALGLLLLTHPAIVRRTRRRLIHALGAVERPPTD